MVMQILILSVVKIKACERTRGHDLSLVKEKGRLDVRNISFLQSTINVWNDCYVLIVCMLLV